MTPISIREATNRDAPILRSFIKLMVEEMASIGGYPVSTDEAVWTGIEGEIRDNADKEDHLFLLACPGERAEAPLGVAAAFVMGLEPIFEPQRLLHISALYVLPSHRKQGIGEALLRAVLEWGRRKGCAAAELNVLAGNPARSLYEKLGFAEFEVKMMMATGR